MSEDCTYRCWVYLRDRELALNNEVLAAANAVIRMGFGQKLERQEPTLREMPAKILSRLNGHPVTQNAVALSLGIGERTVRTAFGELKRAGLVTRKCDGWILTKNAKGNGA